MTSRFLQLSLALSIAVFATSGPVRAADAVADFYKNKTVSIYVGVAAGGLYSTFAQTLARYMGKHIPGNPKIIVEHQLGAGGIVAANNVYNALPKDGTVLMTPLSQTAKRVVLGDPAPKYDPKKWNWLGGWGEAVVTCSVFNTAPAQTIAEARQKENVIGSFDTGSLTYTYPLAANSLIGTKFKMVLGYPGGNEVRIAMERGEVHGLCAQYDGWKSTRPQWLSEGKLTHLVQFASKGHPDLPNVPLLSSFAKTDEDRQIMKFVEWGIEDRAMVMAPGVPEDRVKAMEKAYMDTLRDPEFIAEAEKLKFEIAPITGQEIRDFVDEIMALKPETVDKIKKSMGLDKI
jgi:tripartite-type tricarboxylate transporter receptor subunit TctC